jgi:hypothetical protein
MGDCQMEAASLLAAAGICFETLLGARSVLLSVRCALCQLTGSLNTVYQSLYL